MKKLWLVVALIALGGMTISALADVQNIRLSGDIRLRGYYLSNVAGDAVEDQDSVDDHFLSQRTRISVEADLEDHVLVVVTLKAEGLWGQDNQDDDVVDGSGSGMSYHSWSGYLINRNWDIGVCEAYVQLNEVFYTPATLKLGRQYLHYGRGLILSSVEQEYNFDAARIVLDYYPLTVDFVWAKAVSEERFGRGVENPDDAELLFLNARYEMSESLIKDVELYFGALANHGVSIQRVMPSIAGGSPMIIGLRSDMNLTKNLQTWVEGAYEFGTDGSVGNGDISAWLVNVGGKMSLGDKKNAPMINVNYIYASGGLDPSGNYTDRTFLPWFDYGDGYNGYLFNPMLANIHILNLGCSVKPAENLTLSLQGYGYFSVDTVPGNPGVGLVGNQNVDIGGLGYSPSGSSHDLGWELDTILGYDYSKDVRFQLVYATFIPENAFTVYASDAVAHLVRGEVNVKF